MTSTPSPDSVERVIIIGAGCAGYTAAIYASRSNLKPIVFEGIQPGGQLTITTAVENFPGFPEGVQGPDLMDQMRKQASRFGSRIISKPIASADLSVRPFRIQAGNQTWQTHALIVATGASSRWLGIPSEEPLKGRGVSTCATCDGYFFKDEDMIVVGGGDSAMEEALFLARIGRSVSVVHRRDKLRASKLMQERALAHPKIQFIWDSVITQVLDPAKGAVEAAMIKNLKTGETTRRPVKGIFVAIGHDPNTAFLRGQLELDTLGYIKTHDGVRTSVDGVFACGDVQDHVYRQAITAAGTGCMAAIDAERWLEAQNLG